MEFAPNWLQSQGADRGPTHRAPGRPDELLSQTIERLAPFAQDNRDTC